MIFLVLISNAEAETTNQTMEGGMDVEITYPSKAIIDRTISISFLVKNNGWEDKQEVVFVFGSSNTIVPIQKNEIRIDRISAGGSYGETVDFKIISDAAPGSHFLNLEYSQVVLANNDEPQPPAQTNIAVSLLMKDG